MKQLRVFLYTLIHGIGGLRKNVFMILSSIYVVFVTLLLIGSLSLLSRNLQNELKQYTDKPEIRVDCSSDVSNADALLLMRKIEAHPAVKEITYISKEENLAKFIELLGEDSDLFQNYSDGANAFYASFDVKLRDSSSAEDFVESMYKVDGVEYVKDNISVVKWFQRIQKIIQIGSFSAIFVLGALSIFLASNTIKLTVLARKKEIEIEKYVGASVFYIEGPFIIEGIAIGLIGSILSYITLDGLYSIILKRTQRSGSSLFNLLPYAEAGNHFMAWFLLFGIAVGVVASIFAIKKYEKV